MQSLFISPLQAIAALLRADLIVQWHNRRALRLALIVPLIVLFAWKSAVTKLGAPFVLSTCITIGLMASGLMGYAVTLARDRDSGIFQRLRITPVPLWCIMASRLLVQLVMIFLLTAIVLAGAFLIDHIALTPAGYALTFLASLIGGAMYLSLGQMIAGLQKNAETINATTRLVYFVFVMVGMLGQTGVLGHGLQQLVRWSPYGTVNTVLAAGMQPAVWNTRASVALLVTLGYAGLFAFTGIRLFRWK